MKKNKNKSILWATILIIGFIAFGFFIWNTYNKPYSSDNYNAERTSYENSSENSTNSPSTDDSTPSPSPSPVITEEPLSSFGTKIYNKDSARQNNINITCQALNETIVTNGNTFSFCNTIGPATSDKGYQKADIFDRNGNKKKGLGGGNCQISSTLYNAVLVVPNLVVTERHQHSNKVPYIQSGKDAAVAYGSYDFKFVNQTGNDIKILASSDGNSVNIEINKLVQS